MKIRFNTKNIQYYIKLLIFIILLLGIVFWVLQSNREFTRVYLTREEFNTKFNTDVVSLPQTLIALGFTPNSVTIYKENSPIQKNKGPDQHFAEKSKNHNLQTTLDYWIHYIHPKLEKKNYVVILCVSDGYLERIPYYGGELTYFKADENEFHQKFEVNTKDQTKIPLLHKDKHILAYSKRPNDIYTIPIPDRYYTASLGHKSILETIDKYRIPWETKKQLCIYRANPDNGTSCNLIGRTCSDSLNQRKFFIQMYKQGTFINLDYNEQAMPPQDQLKYKYILDIDGWSNTWDATVWKLYSGSVLLKCKSVWKQWYYDDLKEFVHYVPVANDFSDLNQKIEWCKTHDKECQEITQNAIHFVKTKLTWDQVIKDCVTIVQKYI